MAKHARMQKSHDRHKFCLTPLMSSRPPSQGAISVWRVVNITCAGMVFVLVAAAAGRSAEPTETVLWFDPGRVETLDFTGGLGGRARAPRPPFTFIEEDTSGTAAKIIVRDARGMRWTAKWG